MGRIAKRGFDYFPADVDMFQDRKIRRLLRFSGGEGFTIYIYLLTEIYRNEGYYLEWDQGSLFDISDDLNLPEEIIEKSVEKCCELGLFHSELFQKMRVISSESIQKRYLKIAIQAKRKDVEILEKLEIIDKQLTYFQHSKKIDSEEMPINPEEKGVSPEEMPINPEESAQRKEKESKVKERKGKGGRACARKTPKQKISFESSQKKQIRDLPGAKKEAPPGFAPPPPKKSRGSPPGMSAVVEIFIQKDCPEAELEARLFWNYYQGRKWRDRSGQVDWKLKADSWVIRAKKFHKENKKNESTSSDRFEDIPGSKAGKTQAEWGEL